MHKVWGRGRMLHVEVHLDVFLVRSAAKLIQGYEKKLSSCWMSCCDWISFDSESSGYKTVEIMRYFYNNVTERSIFFINFTSLSALSAQQHFPFFEAKQNHLLYREGENDEVFFPLTTNYCDISSLVERISVETHLKVLNLLSK